jgi:hypothetical protein
VDDDSQKRHVQFRINSDGTQLTSQSAHVISKFNPEQQIIRNVATANGIQSSDSSDDTRISNSAPLIRTNSATNEQIKESIKPKRSLSRIDSSQKSMKEFRIHPERFLSASNRYLPLLRRQALEIESKELHSKQQKDRNDSIKKQRSMFSPPMSRLSDGSDLIYDDAKSFLSEENELGFVHETLFLRIFFNDFSSRKSTPRTQLPIWLEQGRKVNKKHRSSSKLDMMQTMDDDEEENSERQMAIARLRDREFAHLNELIRSIPIEQILEPFSAIKTEEQNLIEQQKLLDYQRQSISTTTDQSPLKSTKIRRLSEILHSIDSLRCSDTVDRRARRQVDIEKNRAKLGILIF